MIVTARNHEIRADEPTEIGGEDSGMTPSEIFLAGLGACVSITLRMYAAHKGYVLKNLRIDLSLFSEKAGGKDRHRVLKEIYFEGEFDESARKRLLNVAERCPVQKMLKGEVNYETVFGE